MLKRTGVIRRLDELGRIGIPKELVTSFGIKSKKKTEPGSLMDIYIEDGTIRTKVVDLNKQEPVCGISRRVDAVNRITLPVEYERTLGLSRKDLSAGEKGSIIEFYVDGNNIVLKPYENKYVKALEDVLNDLSNIEVTGDPQIDSYTDSAILTIRKVLGAKKDAI
ncbi:MAG: hypothetical protein ACI4WU_04965 [Bacilli bacterium]